MSKFIVEEGRLWNTSEEMTEFGTQLLNSYLLDKAWVTTADGIQHRKWGSFTVHPTFGLSVPRSLGKVLSAGDVKAIMEEMGERLSCALTSEEFADMDKTLVPFQLSQGVMRVDAMGSLVATGPLGASPMRVATDTHGSITGINYMKQEDDERIKELEARLRGTAQQ